MKTQGTRWLAGAAAALASLLLAGQARALDVIDPTGAAYLNITDSSHFAGGWEGLHMFNWDLSAVTVGSVLTGSEFAKSGGGTSYVAFDMDQVYTGIGSVFYAQRQGANPTADKINWISLWASSSAPFAAADPGTPPDSVIAITNSAGGLWLEYLLTNTVSGQYFLLKFEQSSSSGNPGGNEFRLGASLGLPPTVLAVSPPFTNTYTGNTVEFSVQASGTAPLYYQWQAGPVGSGTFTNLTDNANLSGATTSVLTVRNLSLADVDYQVVITNQFGKATSAPATLSVSTSLPQVLSAVTPETLQQPSGYAFSLSVDVAGSMPITYQWKRNGQTLSNDGRISGADSNVLTIANAENGDAGTYQLFLNNTYGNASSTEATVTIVPSLQVLSPTGTIYSNVRDSSHFSSGYVAANLFTHNVTGLAPGSTLSGAEFAKNGPGTSFVAFEVDNVYTVGSVYFAQRAGSTTGDNAQKLSIWASETASFATTDPGTAPLAVIPLLPNTGTPVWKEYFLPASITARYFLLKLEQTTITGNPGGNEMRLGLARLTPAVVSNPTNAAAFNGNSVEFTVGASGGTPLAYQWQARSAGSSSAFTNVLNNANITGANSATLTLRNIPLADVEYRAIVSNPSGSVTSAAAILTVTTSAPQIVTDASPAAIRHPAGYSFSIPVSVLGSGPITYTWRHNGQVLSNGGRISGAQSSVLTVAAAQAGDAGTYQLSMSNAYGNITSAQVTMTIEQEGLAFYDGSAWTLNGGATIDGGDVLTLTDGGVGQARSAFFNTVVPVDAFTASFVYQDVMTGGADGVAFILQNAPAGPAALGPGGGFLGYVGIAPSAALTFNIYNNPGIALKTGGTVGGYASTAPVNIAGGSPIQVNIKYVAGTMIVVLTDTFTTESYTNTFNIDLAAAVGGRTAYVGFSGADGAIASHQTISAFTFAPLTAGAPELVADVKSAKLTQPAGLSFSLAAAFSGTDPMTFQWKRNGVDLSDDARLSGTRSNRLSVANALPGDEGNYQLFVSNFYGSTNSSVVAVTLTNAITLGDGSAWTFNGGCTVADEVLTLTDGGNSQARSAFLNGRVPVDAFVASFTYTDVTTGGADGAVFLLHNAPAGPLALGAGGGTLGYSEIAPSAAIELNIYENSAGGRGIAFATNGLTAQNGGDAYASTAPVDLAGGNPIDVVLRYAGGVLSVTLTDAVAGTSFTTNYNVNLPAVVQGHSAYFGFTGATGGVTAHQTISNVKFVPMPALAIQLTANFAVISWPVTPASYVVQQSSEASGSTWQNVTAPVNAVNGEHQVTVPLSSGKQFYRLALP